MSDIRYRIEELSIPSAPGEAGWPDFAAAVAVRNLVEAEAYGSTELSFTAEEVLPFWLNYEFEPMRLFVARVDAEIVGRAVYETLPDASPEFAWLTVEVHPHWRGRGIGGALLDQVEAVAAAEGRHELVTYVVSPPGPGERMPSPTGFGSVPKDNLEVRFLLGRGYHLEQVERGSRLPLPLAANLLPQIAATLAGHATADYRVECWSGRTPDHWLTDLALLHTRMSTDAPTAGLEEPEDIWTVPRLIAAEDLGSASPRTTLTAVAVHVPSGHLAGFTQLSVPVEKTRSVNQEDTLVLREHRGHRLGMLLKIANLEYLQESHPGHRSVVTFNAEENRPMLTVNEALGFEPMGYEGAWKRVVE